MKKELTLVEETTVNRYKTALEQCWEIATDNLITGDNKAKMIRDVSRATLDGEPTTADEYNEEEDVQLGCSIVKSNNEIDKEQRDPNIRRSSTVHYPDWDMKKKEYVVPLNKRKINKMNDAIKSTPEYKLGKKLLGGEISNVTIDNIIDKETAKK